MSDITLRQQRILDFIGETVRERGYPPTVREIGEAVGLTSSSSVHAQLANLERKGMLHKDPTKPRAMTLAEPRAEGIAVPLLGRIAAGAPLLADEHGTVSGPILLVLALAGRLTRQLAELLRPLLLSRACARPTLGDGGGGRAAAWRGPGRRGAM